MIQRMAEENRFHRQLPFYIALGSLLIFFPIIIHDPTFGVILYLLVVAPIVSLFLLVIATRRKVHQRLAILSMLAVYWLVSWTLVKNSVDVRASSRWFIRSKDYKAKVLALPDSGNGEFRHIEWDGWGFAGAGDTNVYLVFDPSDSLSAAAKSHSPGKFSGIPCEISRIRRLESQWYSVVFYTDTGWGHCT
jgi:hypothetical protein